MPRKRYPPEVKEWVYEYVKTHTNNECAEAAKEVWPEWGLTVGRIKNLRYYKTSRAPGAENRPYGRGGRKNIFTQDIFNYIIANYKNARAVDLTRNINEKFGTDYPVQKIRDFMMHRGLRTGAPNHYEIAFNAQPIGSVRKLKSGGYLKKVSQKKWRTLAAAAYEELYGPVPKGYRVIVLDGDKGNVSPENLMLVTYGEQSRANLVNLRTNDPDLTKAKILSYRLRDAIKERSKTEQEG